MHLPVRKEYMLVCTTWREIIVSIIENSPTYQFSHILLLPAQVYDKLSIRHKYILNRLTRRRGALLSNIKPQYRIPWDYLHDKVSLHYINLASEQHYFICLFHEYEAYRYHLQKFVPLLSMWSNINARMGKRRFKNRLYALSLHIWVCRSTSLDIEISHQYVHALMRLCNVFLESSHECD